MRATKRIDQLTNEVITLRRNVADLQQQLNESYIKIKNQRQALEDVAKILKTGLKRHEETA